MDFMDVLKLSKEDRTKYEFERGYRPGHIFKVVRGPYVGQIGQWAQTWAEGVIGLNWPGCGQHAIAFRLTDLEDITDDLV